MEKTHEKFIDDLLKNTSRSLVGRLCKQIESLQKNLDNSSNEFKYLNHAKNLHREMVYETFRDLKNQIHSYNLGLNFKKFNINTSNESNKIA